MSIPFRALMIALLASIGLTATAQDSLADSLKPDPSLTPAEVVRAQLEALRANDAEDRGIAVAFRFAAPSNRAMTGPVERFGRMIKAGQYALMLNYVEAVYDPIEVRGDKARQRVMLIGQQQTMRFEFYLGRQSVSPYEDCWMTEAVSAVPLGGSVASASTVPEPLTSGAHPAEA